MKKTLQRFLGLLALVVSSYACSSLNQLDKVKALALEQRYADISTQEIQCKDGEEGCNQLHLIKGDACYRQAKGQDEPSPALLTCAIGELEQGIKTSNPWPSQLGSRAQYYTNLCESLRLLQDSQQLPDAIATNTKLLATSTDFLKAEPKDLAANYFIHSARFAQFQLNPGRLNDSVSACSLLSGQLVEVNDLQRQSISGPYEPNFRRLQLDLQGLKRTIKNCP